MKRAMLCAALALLAAPCCAQSWSGTWKLNVATMNEKATMVYERQ